MSSHSEQLLPPNDPNEFELLCLDLWKEIWGDPGAQKNGRRGQSQDGVDIFGQCEGKWIGIQCKQKNGLSREKLKSSELEAEVEAAKKFDPPLACLILATSGPQDEKVQKKARQLTDSGAFQVQVWAWHDIWHALYERKDLLRRIGRVYWPQQWHIIEQQVLQTQSMRKSEFGQFHMVPDLPPHFLNRETDLVDLRAKVLNGLQKGNETSGSSGSSAVSSSLLIGLHGMGGIGKTAMAAALSRDPVVRSAFPDGVFWLTISQTPDLLSRLHQLAQALTGQSQVLRDLQHGRGLLSDLLGDRTSLIILDDVWSVDHASTFNVLGARCRMLVTTRDEKVLKLLHAESHCVGLLSHEQSLELLASWAGTTTDNLPWHTASDVVRECGYLPLAIAMVGAQSNRPGRMRDERLELMLTRLRENSLDRFEQHLSEYQYPHLLRAIEVSVQALTAETIPSLGERYLDFSVFPEDAAIPVRVLQTFWRPLGLTLPEVDEIIERLRQLSLLRQGEDGRLSLHDVLRSYTLKQVGEGQAELQDRFVNAYRGSAIAGWHTVQPDGYYYEHLALHLNEARRQHDLRLLVLDFNWMWRKLEVATLPSLLRDFSYVHKDDDVALVRSAVEMSAPVISQDKTQITGQLLGRLPAKPSGLMEGLRRQVANWRQGAWLMPQCPSLRPAGDEFVFELKGHNDDINGAALTTDGRWLVSASEDRTLRVWDFESGEAIHTLHGNAGPVLGVAVIPGEHRAVSVSFEGTIRVWDLKGGVEMFAFKGSHGPVTSLAVSRDARMIVFGSADAIITIWDIVHRRPMGLLVGHTGGVRAIAIDRHGRRVLSGASDGTIIVWDIALGKKLHTLSGHANSINALALTSDDKRLVSASADKSLKVWNVDSGQFIMTLEGHSKSVSSVGICSNDWRVVSGSDDRTIKIWDLADGCILRTLEGHGAAVSTVVLGPDGRRFVSGSYDHTLRIWDLSGESTQPKRGWHNGPVRALALNPRTYYGISVANDRTMRIWDLRNGQLLHSVEATVNYSAFPVSVTISPDGMRAISIADDFSLRCWDLKDGRTPIVQNDLKASTHSTDCRRAVSIESYAEIKVWDLMSGSALAVLPCKMNPPKVLAVSADGRWAASASRSQRLAVMDLESGEELFAVDTHGSLITAMALSPEGRRTFVFDSGSETYQLWDLEQGKRVFILHEEDSNQGMLLSPDWRRAVSASKRGVVKLWDVENGRELSAFKPHVGLVTTAAISSDGTRLVTGSNDQTLKVWDVENGQCLVSFTGESAMTCCALADDSRTVIAGERSGRVHFLRFVLPDDQLEEDTSI